MITTTPTQIPTYVKKVVDSYAHIMNCSVADVIMASVIWIKNGSTEAAQPRSSGGDITRVSVRVDTKSLNAISAPVPWRDFLATAALTLPLPPKPLLLWTYLNEPKRARRHIPRTDPAHTTITLPKRQTAHLRHLSQAWSMSVPEVVKILIATHPCMHLPATITPPLVMNALRGVSALAPASDQEIVVIEG